MSSRDPKRVPPGQTLTTKFPVLTYGDTPHVDLATWDLQTAGLVQTPLRLSWSEFRALPETESTSDFHCVTTWSRLDNRWRGVSFSEIAQRSGVLPEAKFVLLSCEGGYTTNLALEDCLRPDVLLAFRHDGQDLSPDHGWPLRLVVPHLYAWKSAKWLRKIEFLSKDKRGFWEKSGYHNHADPWTEERYSWQEKK
jgi:DMSO/TMAO reductase YedYZ molybdopterin-dependent catalytic subunit